MTQRYTVKNIQNAKHTFKDVTQRKTVRISNALKSICVFGKNNPNKDILISFNSGEHLKKIEQSSFEGCNNLVSVVLQPTIDVIDDNAFKDCKNLSAINLDIGTLKYIGNNAFDNIGLETLNCVISVDSMLDLKHENESASNAFNQQFFGENIITNCEKLETVTITANCVPTKFITNCKKLKNICINIKDESKTISDIAANFAVSCNNVEDLEINGDIIDIPQIPEFPALKTLCIKSNNGYVVPSQLLAKCKNIKSITFDKNIKLDNIQTDSFAASNLSEIKFNGISSTELTEFITTTKKTPNQKLSEVNRQLGIFPYYEYVDYDTTDNFQTGKWYANTPRVLSYAAKKNIPTIVWAGVDGCGGCINYLNLFFNNKLTHEYFTALPYLLVFDCNACGHYTNSEHTYNTFIGYTSYSRDSSGRIITDAPAIGLPELKFQFNVNNVIEYKINKDTKTSDVVSRQTKKYAVRGQGTWLFYWKKNASTCIQSCFARSYPYPGYKYSFSYLETLASYFKDQWEKVLDYAFPDCTLSRANAQNILNNIVPSPKEFDCWGLTNNCKITTCDNKVFTWNKKILTIS